MASSLLPHLQKYLRTTSAPRRQMVRSPQYDEQAGFGEALARKSHAKLLEPEMRAIAVGECAIADNQFCYFLDGIQRSWLLYYQDYVPVYYGYTAAAIRQRQERLLTKWDYKAEEALYVPYAQFDPTELELLKSNQLPVIDTTPRTQAELPSAGESQDNPDLDKQPMALREGARNTISDSREHLESNLAKAWVQKNLTGWLVMDGSITISKDAATHPRVVGLIKSHNTQYFDFPEQEVIFNLKLGERSSTFTPPGRHPVCSWYLRMRVISNEDFYFGLVRVETALKSKDRVDEISRWIMTERRPLSLPDSRWDKMIYPIRDCEQFLRSQEPSRAAFGWLN